MFITRALMFFVRRRHIPGKLDIGKHQLIKPVTPSMKKKAVAQLLLEQDNLKMLQRPYLKLEEERGHVVACGRLAKMHMDWKDKTIQKRMPVNYTMEQHLDHLNVTKKWE